MATVECIVPLLCVRALSGKAVPEMTCKPTTSGGALAPTHSLRHRNRTQCIC